jgi:salicylate hydroxylase
VKVVIVGGGIAGLSSAIGLRRLGMEAVVLEQAPRFGMVGAGIVLAPNAMRALDWLGAGDSIRAINAPIGSLSYNDIASGTEITRTELGDKAAERFGRHMYTTHRGDLVNALAACLPPECVRLDSRVERIEEGANGVTVHLAGGEAIEGDLLIGADGLRSTVRAHLYGEQEAVFTGSMAWRTVFPASLLPHRPTTFTKVWAGPGRHAVRYPIRKGTEFYSAFYVPAEEIHRETWEASGDISDLRASFAECCEEVAEILEVIDQAFITGIYFHDPIEQWHRGRILLIGDSAHSVLPTAGSGSGLALEDSVMLAIAFQRHGTDYERAFAEFQARRWDRTTRVQVTSRADLDTFHETDPAQTIARNGRFRGISQIDPIGEVRWSWIYTYDAEAAAAKSISEIESAKRQDNPLQRPEARRAFDLWRGALTVDDNAHGWFGQRRGFDRFATSLEQVPADVELAALEIGGVRVLSVVPPGGRDGPCLLHCHGGGHVLGSADSAVALAARLARACGGRALVPDFRRAPENPYPAALDDVAAVWDHCANEGEELLLTGEGSGAALALSLALRLRRDGGRLPARIGLFSPMLDPLLKAASIDANAELDPWGTRILLTGFAGSYLQDASPDDPLVSPLKADLSGLPPIQVWAATHEALYDDAVRLAEGVRAAGGEISLVPVPDSVPSFVLFPFLPETESAVRAFGEAVRSSAVPATEPSL